VNGDWPWVVFPSHSNARIGVLTILDGNVSGCRTATPRGALGIVAGKADARNSGVRTRES
jgi:hypothetical protein